MKMDLSGITNFGFTPAAHSGRSLKDLGLNPDPISIEHVTVPMLQLE